METLTLTLIRNASLADGAPMLTRDSIRYLLKALIYADAAFSAEIETALVKTGNIALPELIKGLGHENLNVRSTSAMALIRIGQPAEQAVLDAYPRYCKKPQSRWVFQFILQEWNLACPQLVESSGVTGVARAI